MGVCSICTNRRQKQWQWMKQLFLIVKYKNIFHSLNSAAALNGCGLTDVLLRNRNLEFCFSGELFGWHTALVVDVSAEELAKQGEGWGEGKVKLCLYSCIVFYSELSPHKSVLLLLRCCFVVMDRSASVNTEEFQRSDSTGGSPDRGCSNCTETH